MKKKKKNYKAYSLFFSLQQKISLFAFQVYLLVAVLIVVRYILFIFIY